MFKILVDLYHIDVRHEGHETRFDDYSFFWLSNVWNFFSKFIMICNNEKLYDGNDFQEKLMVSKRRELSQKLLANNSKH